MTAAPEAPAVQERTASRGRRVGGWIAIGIVVLVVGGLGAALSGMGAWTARDALDPESPAPWGTRALAAILRDQGVEVTVVRDHEEALTALRAEPATLVMADAPALSDDAVTALGSAAADLVLIDPRARTLRLFLPGSEPAGIAADALVEPGCDLPDAQRSGAIRPGAVFAPGGEGITACYPSGGGSALLVAEDGDHRIAAVDGAAILANESLARDGDAALGVNLMGRHATVIWYVPSVADTDLAATDPGLGELTPPWVSPAIVVLLAAGLAAGIWRGRRFGPLVAERLPVTVRAAETAEGRGRLYAHARDRVHAADQLRIGALGRLGRTLGLPRSASATEIADAVADLLGADRRAVRGILIDDLPHSDRDLVSLHESLRTLEHAARAAVHPERNST